MEQNKEDIKYLLKESVNLFPGILSKRILENFNRDFHLDKKTYNSRETIKKYLRPVTSISLLGSEEILSGALLLRALGGDIPAALTYTTVKGLKAFLYYNFVEL